MADSDGKRAEDDRSETHGTAPRIQIEEMVVTEDTLKLYHLLRRFAAGVLPQDDGSNPPPLFHRIKCSFAENAPHLREACGNSGSDLLRWSRSGSPLRTLLVVSVGTTAFLALTGLSVFILFVLAATINAIILSVLVSMAAAGSFLAIFFACLTTIYIGALSVAAMILSIITISAIIAMLVTAGWLGFLWVIWLTVKKSMELTKQSLSTTGSVFAAYSAARRIHHYHSKKGTE